MTKEEYDKVFQHITDLAQKHALGKIPHQNMYDGLKKLLEELITKAVDHSAQIQGREAFWKGWRAGVGLSVGLAFIAFVLWQKGWLSEWMKGLGF